MTHVLITRVSSGIGEKLRRLFARDGTALGTRTSPRSPPELQALKRTRFDALPMANKLPSTEGQEDDARVSHMSITPQGVTVLGLQPSSAQS